SAMEYRPGTRPPPDRYAENRTVPSDIPSRQAFTMGIGVSRSETFMSPPAPDDGPPDPAHGTRARVRATQVFRGNTERRIPPASRSRDGTARRRSASARPAPGCPRAVRRQSSCSLPNQQHVPKPMAQPATGDGEFRRRTTAPLVYAPSVGHAVPPFGARPPHTLEIARPPGSRRAAPSHSSLRRSGMTAPSYFALGRTRREESASGIRSTAIRGGPSA